MKMWIKTIATTVIAAAVTVMALMTVVTKPDVAASQSVMLDTAMQSVVAIYHPSIGIPASGFYIGNGIIVTAGHVAKVEGLEKVVFEDGDEYSVLEQIVCPNYDCGFLLLLSEVDEPMLKFDLVKVQRGEIVYVLGNPSGLTFNVSKGIISSINRLCDGYFGNTVLIGYDAIAASGSSGSPVIDEDGEVRGVHVGDNGFHGSAVAITTDDILRAFDAIELQRPILERNE